MNTITLLISVLLIWLPPAAPPAEPSSTAPGGSIQFFGAARGGIDRVVIPIDPHVPADVGGDFTIEFWLRAQPGDNPAGSCTTSTTAGDGWIFGHIVLDRDIDDTVGTVDRGDYGLSLAAGRVCFGVARGGGGGGTIAGGTVVTDGAWRHIAVTRSAATGRLRIFVDGRLDGEGAGPPGDISYRDGRPTSRPASDPFLVIAAEKHDYPGVLGYRGRLDELRISSSVRYAGDFARPAAPFTPDAQTAALYRFDEGAGTTVGDAAPGGLSRGELRVGGTPAGPTWSSDTPFAAQPPPALDRRLFLPTTLR